MSGTKGISEPTIANGSTDTPVATVLIHRRLDNPRSGSGVYLLECLSCLEQAGYRVRIVLAPVTGFGSQPASRPARDFHRNGMEIIWPDTVRIGDRYISKSPAVWKRALRRTWQQACWRLGRRFGASRPVPPNTLGKVPPEAEMQRMAQAANRTGAAVTVAEYSSLAPVLGLCDSRYRGVLLHDLFSLRTESFEGLGLCPDHESLTLETESARLAAADFCIQASVTETRALSKLLPDKRHIWLRPQARPRPVATQGVPRVVFIGVRHGGNLDALNLLLKDIWPSVRQALPTTQLWVVGEVAQWVSGDHPGVRKVGFVDSLDSVGGANAIGIAPIRAASGISIKLATYMELGMAVVAYRKTLEGYGDAIDGLLVAVDTPQQFAQSLIELLSDDDKRQALAAKAQAELPARLNNADLIAYFKSLSAP